MLSHVPNIYDGDNIHRKDLTGRRFGALSVVSMFYEKTGGKFRGYCVCKCDCGNEHIVTSSSIQNRKEPSCRKCSYERRSQKSYIDNVGERYNHLTIVEELREFKPTRVRCICDCGNEITTVKADVVIGHTQSCGCYQRMRVRQRNTKDFSGYKSPFGVLLISRVRQDDRGRWLWNCKCGVCDTTFVALPAKVKNGHITSCGCRKTSSREELIEQILITNKINFKREVRFPDCKDKHTLPFDFAIYDQDGELKLLCEYDGKQHEVAIPFWGDVDGLHNIQKHDCLKTAYCLQESIPLIRLSHWMTDKEIKTSILNTENP